MKHLYLLLSVMFLSGIVNAQYTLQNDDVTIEDGVITACSYDFSSTDIVIPEMINSQIVKSINDEVFYFKGITSVVFPASLERIGYKAFNSNSITSVSFPENSMIKYIGETAFAGNANLSITLPTNANTNFVKYMDGSGNSYRAGGSFTNFYKFLNAQIPYELSSDEVSVTDGVITSCSLNSGHTDIIIPSSVDGETITGIASGTNFEGVFSGLSLTSVTLPASIKRVGKYAFGSNKIVEVSFEAPSSLEVIEAGAFRSNNGLAGVVLPSHFNSAFLYYKDDEGNEYSGGDMFTDHTVAYTAVIPYTLTSSDVIVENGYIQSCSYDFESTSIIIPSVLDGQTITGIAEYSYYGSPVFYDKGITSVVLPNTLEYIGSNAFANNDLTTLELPASLKIIKEMAFYANDITKVSFHEPSKIEIIEAYAFYANYSVEITLPEHSSGANVTYTGGTETNITAGTVVTDKTIEYSANLVAQVTISFDGNNNSAGSVPEDILVVEDGSVTLPGGGSLVKEGYTFTGWNTQDDGAGVDYQEGETLTVSNLDVILYASWEIANGVDKLKSDDFKVFPNITSGKIQFLIKNNNSIDNYVEVYSLSGVLVKTIPLQAKRTSGDISDLANGVYIFMTNGSQIGKVIKR